jgi:small ligand-binding sensory domain FIST
MKIANSVTATGDSQAALAYALSGVLRQLEGVSPDLVVVFLTPHFEDDFEEIRGRLTKSFGDAMLVGVTAEGVIGEDREHERIPAMSLWAASLPGAKLRPFYVDQADLEVTSETKNWHRLLAVPPDPKPTFLMFVDPFRIHPVTLLNRMNVAYPGCPVVGGIASGADAPGQNILWLNDRVYRDGAIGVAITGGPEIVPVVSQGCRPIGHHLIITKSEDNIIHELGGKSAVQTLSEMMGAIPDEDVSLARQGLLIGRAINEYQETFSQGDFLIRSLMGIDQGSGAIAVGDLMRTGSTVQFHVRDGRSADDDLRTALRGRIDTTGRSAGGAILCTCNGRGTRMWSEPNHDVGAIRDICGDIPVSGFFAAGEIGPVGGENFLHGHTASIALFFDSA